MPKLLLKNLENRITSNIQYVIPIMDIQIIDVSKMKQHVDIKNRYDIRPSPGEKCVVTKTPMEFLPKDMVSCDDISCERTKKGMTDNCSLCQNINNDIFVRCETKFSGQ